MTASHRRRIAFAVLIGLIVFLLGSLQHQAKRRDEAVAALQRTNEAVVNKLAEVLERTIRAEQAALEVQQTPLVRVEDIIAQVKGIDQALIDEALQKAYKAVASTPGPAGPTGATGARGPVGPPGTAATTTTAPASTTTTTRAPPRPTTTSSTTRPTTTTTRPCALGLLGACVLRGPAP